MKLFCPLPATRLVLPIVFSLLSTLAFTQSNLIQVTDMLRIKQLGNVEMSKDGSLVVFTVVGAIPDEKNKWEYNNLTQIWMLALDGQSKPILLSGQKESASQPALSPDGNTLAFVRSVDQKPQIFLMNLKAPGEPMQLTAMANGASSPSWHGKKILFSSSYKMQDAIKDSVLNSTHAIPPFSNEKPGFDAAQQWASVGKKLNPDGGLEEVRAYLDQNEKDNKAKVITKLNFQQEATTSAQMNMNYAFEVEAAAGAKPKPVFTGLYPRQRVQWIGQTMDYIFEAPLQSNVHPDRAQVEQAIYVKTAGAAAQKLLGSSDSSFSSASLSPSGNWMAFQFSVANTVSQPQLAITRVDNAKGRLVVPIDRSAGNVHWSADEKQLYFTATSNGGMVLYAFNLTTQKLQQLSSFNEGILSFDEAAGKMVVVKTEPSNPYELYVCDAEAKNMQRISDFNYSWVKDKQLSLPEKRSFKNEKGLEVEYWIMKPANWEQGKKYPTILEIHGGPTAMWGPGESSMWHEYQYYCAKGYAVVYSNPRGSGGYGSSFLKANVGDWGQGPMSDVLTALDKSAREFSWIDTSKLAVTGGSYAGYLVAYILGHDQRFKVACAQRGVYDLRTFFGEGNAWRLVPNYFGGYPWNKKTYDLLEKESPINYVQNVTTPLIIFHGENDLRTGVIQSEQFYRSLKVMGRTVEYVRHPGATHEITRSGNNRQRIDQMLRTWEFFERFIQH